MYPIPSNEEFVKSDKYLWYDGFEKEGISYIDEDKNIYVHESCVNLSQEDHSQYIPFEMERYYHGIDLMEMTLQIYFVNSKMGANISTPINVSYSDYRIRFGWLVDRAATAVSGTLMFEIRAIGTVTYEDGKENKDKDLTYVWKSHTNSQITILKSLAGDTPFVPSIDWYDALIRGINKTTNELIEGLDGLSETAKEVSNYADNAESSAAAALASENAAKNSETVIQNIINTSEASAQRSDVKAILAESWAVGGTNSRTGEDENNAKYWCQTTENMLDTFRSDMATDATNLETEIARAKSAESSLSNRIDMAVTRASAMESALSDRIDAENTRALSAESTLTTNLNATSTALSEETSRATSAENALSGRVTTNAVNISTNATAITEIQNHINSLETELATKSNQEEVDVALAAKADIDHIHNYIYIGTEEPTDTSTLLWVDTVNGLKYYNGSAWVNVPMVTS